jgi:hypothetical protein
MAESCKSFQLFPPSILSNVSISGLSVLRMEFTNFMLTRRVESSFPVFPCAKRFL